MSQLFGCGSVAQTVLSKGALGEPLTIHVGFTLGVMMAVFIAGGVSGKRHPAFHTDRVTAHSHCNAKTSTSHIIFCGLHPASWVLQLSAHFTIVEVRIK